MRTSTTVAMREGAAMGRQMAVFAAAARLVRTLLTWQERAQQRHALAQLDARMLKDVGLSWAEVELELSKSFWHA